VQPEYSAGQQVARLARRMMQSGGKDQAVL
jgi:hypothetical protein